MSTGGAAGLRKSGPGACGFALNLCSLMGIIAPSGMRHQRLASLVYVCGLVAVCSCVCMCLCVHVFVGGGGACIPEPLRTTDEDDGGTLRLFGMWLRSMFCKLALVISVFKALSTELFTTDRA